MATIRNYTDLEQSEVLAKILPLESADMYWSRCTITDFGDGILNVSYAVEPCNISQFRNTKEDVPCWSLAALVDVLPLEVETHKQTDGHKIYYYLESYMQRMGKEIYLSTKRHDNPVDACVEMILKLKEEEKL